MSFIASFLHLRSALQLAELANNPIDLAQEKNFSVKHLESMRGFGLSLLNLAYPTLYRKPTWEWFV